MSSAAFDRGVWTLGTAIVAIGLIGAARGAASDSPVADAAMRRDTAAVRTLLRHGADVNAAQGDGMTALHWAAVHGDSAEARMLIVAGARLELTTRNGAYTPLHFASRSGSSAVLSVLLDAGADANAITTSGGATPLHFAAAQGSTANIAALLMHGAQIDVRDGAWEQTPLMWAAAYDRAAAVELLTARGANVKLVSKVENVPAREAENRADQAARNRRVAALKAADQPPVAGRGDPAGGRGAGATAGRGGGRGNASSGAAQAGAPTRGDSTAVGGGGGRSLGYGDLVGNKGGLTALLFAAREGHIVSARALLKAGADVNQVSASDHTSPLLMAAINGHFDLARLFLEAGADPNRPSDAGATPLYATINVQWAAKSLYPQPTAQYQQQTTYLELMELLLKAGADPNARLTKHLWYMSYNFDLLGVNTAGATPFWRAAYGTDVDAMRLLVRYGADPKLPTIKPSGRSRGDDAPAEDDDNAGGKDPSGLAPVPPGGPGVFPIHAASGVGYGEGYAANAHRHAPDGWLPSVKYLIEELGADVNARDHNGFTPLHHAASRGDNELILYLMSKGADISAVSRRGQTVADMANGPVQRVPPFLETVALLEKLGSKNSHKCKSC
jgi:ankyrin repeat protein